MRINRLWFWIVPALFIFVSAGYIIYRYPAKHCSPLSKVPGMRCCIVESNKIADILPFACEPNVIFVFDIDNTLVCTPTDLGSDQWFSHNVERKIQMGMSYEDAVKEVLPNYFRVQEFITLQPVETATPKIVSRVGKQAHTIALTARSLQLKQRTIDQLKKLGITFAPPPSFAPELPIELDHPGLLKDGIIFCDQNDKGKLLFYIFKKFNYQPAWIIFVDDRLYNLLNVQKESLMQDVRFVGIRYGYMDERSDDFNAEKATAEYEQLIARGAPLPAM